MIVGEVSDVGALGKGGGHHGGGGHHRGGRGFGPGWGWGPGWWGGYDYGPEVLPQDKFVLVGPDGKGTVIVTQIPQNLPAGWTFRRATTAEAALNKPLSGLGQIPEIISTIVKTGADIYAKKQAARTQKKADADAARQQAIAASRQQALVYAGGPGGGFPWLPVILGGVGVVTLGTIGYLLLRKK